MNRFDYDFVNKLKLFILDGFFLSLLISIVAITGFPLVAVSRGVPTNSYSSYLVFCVVLSPLVSFLFLVCHRMIVIKKKRFLSKLRKRSDPKTDRLVESVYKTGSRQWVSGWNISTSKRRKK